MKNIFLKQFSLLLLGAGLAVTTQQASAQVQTISHIFSTGPNPSDVIDVKNYHVKVIPVTGTPGPSPSYVMSDAVMAGTTDANRISGGDANVVEVDNTGTIVNSNVFHHTNCHTVVSDVVLDNNGDYLVTCKVRPHTATGVSTPGGYTTYPPAVVDRDYMVILRVDKNTLALSNQFAVYDNKPLGTLPGLNDNYGHCLYPQHSLFKVVGGKNLLYVTGYYVEEDPRGETGPTYYTGNNMPTMVTPKKTFVMSIDVDAQTVENCKYFNSTTATTTGGNPDYDFDMGLRLKELTGTNDIYVTGSANDQAPTVGTVVDVITRSATLNLVVDANCSRVSEDNFLGPHNGDGYGDHEYGVDIVESNKTGYYHIISNRYPSSDVTNPAYGIDLASPYSVYITSTYLYSLVNRRLETADDFDIGWALQTLPSNSLKDPLNSDDRILIAGYTSYDRGSGASSTNILPFVLDVDVSLPPLVEQSTSYYTVYGNMTGTGNYKWMGGGHHSIYFNPTFADREVGDYLTTFSAPKQDNTFNKLGVKVLVDDIENIPTLPGIPGSFAGNNCGRLADPINPLANPFAYADNQAFVETDEISDMVLTTDFYQPITINYGATYYCYDATGGSYKPSAVEEINGEQVTVYPNPVSTQLNIKNADGATYQVVDMTGRTLTTGTLSSDLATVNTSAFAAGMYIITITKDGHVEKVKFVKE